jgi:hypothetical protein
MRDVRTVADELGYTLDERPLAERKVWPWRRGDDDRYPSFPTQREALACMESRLRFISVFER